MGVIKTVIITEPIADSAIRLLRDKGWQILEEYHEADAAIRNEDVIACINRLHGIDAGWMDQYPNLKIIAYHGVGYDAIDLNAAKERGIAVTITPGQNALAVAEHTVALMIALSKQLVSTANDYRQDGFSCKYQHAFTELSGKTLGLIGLGNIGFRVANMARNGFNMNVIAYDPFLKSCPEGVTVLNDRMEVFRRADYISLHLNLNRDTYKSIGRAEFEAMKDSACFINVSRGAMVKEDELIEALKNGVIAGAALDVTDPEECEAPNPLMHMSNVILTPHVAGSSREALERVANMCIENIETYLSGGEPAGRVG